MRVLKLILFIFYLMFPNASYLSFLFWLKERLIDSVGEPGAYNVAITLFLTLLLAATAIMAIYFYNALFPRILCLQGDFPVAKGRMERFFGYTYKNVPLHYCGRRELILKSLWCGPHLSSAIVDEGIAGKPAVMFVNGNKLCAIKFNDKYIYCREDMAWRRDWSVLFLETLAALGVIIVIANSAMLFMLSATLRAPHWHWPDILEGCYYFMSLTHARYDEWLIARSMFFPWLGVIMGVPLWFLTHAGKCKRLKEAMDRKIIALEREDWSRKITALEREGKIKYHISRTTQ
jgi:hypothetical protein